MNRKQQQDQRKRRTGDVELDLPDDFDLPDLDLDGASETPEEASEDMLAPLFKDYYRPPEHVLPSTEYDPDQKFIDGVTDENKAILTQLENADRHYDASLLAQTRKVTDSGVARDYFVVVVFVSDEQKEQFLEKTGWAQFGGYRFINGVELAKHMGIQLDPGYLSLKADPDKNLAEFVPDSADQPAPKNKRKK